MSDSGSPRCGSGAGETSGIGNLMAVGSLPAPDVDSSDHLRAVDRRGRNIAWITEEEGRPAEELQNK